MTTSDVLALVSAAGVKLSAAGDRLLWRCPGSLPDNFRELLIAHKGELLALLAREEVWAPGAWNQEVADRLLAKLRKGLARMEGDRGRPAVEVAVLRTWLEVAEGYVQDRDQETARGWNVLELLRGTVRLALAPVGNRGEGNGASAIP
jgi:hypothetical protein